MEKKKIIGLEFKMNKPFIPSSSRRFCPPYLNFSKPLTMVYSDGKLSIEELPLLGPVQSMGLGYNAALNEYSHLFKKTLLKLYHTPSHELSEDNKPRWAEISKVVDWCDFHQQRHILDAREMHEDSLYVRKRSPWVLDGTFFENLRLPDRLVPEELIKGSGNLHLSTYAFDAIVSIDLDYEARDGKEFSGEIRFLNFLNFHDSNEYAMKKFNGLLERDREKKC